MSANNKGIKMKTPSSKNPLKRATSKIFTRHFGASAEFFGNFRDDLAGITAASKERREAQYAVHPDEDECGWNQKKWFFLIEIQLYQIGCLGSLAYSAVSNSNNALALLFAVWCGGWYIVKIRDTFRARYVAANWSKRDEPLSMSWKSFARQVRKNPLTLIPAWRIYK